MKHFRLSPLSRFSRFSPLVAVALFAAHCSVDQAPAGIRATPAGTGPEIIFDVERQPLPEIPQPNDVATFADPTSRTGRRINVSLSAPTAMESDAREGFASMEGWGTYAPITVAFTREPGSDQTQAALDLDDIRTRMQNDGHDFTNDPVYVVNLTTGVPVMLDMGDGNFPMTPQDLTLYWPNDPKINQENIVFESVEEGVGLSQAQYTPSIDIDFDGVLDHPNTLGPLGPGQIHGVDDLLTWYERETDTLIMHPLLPMDEKTEYAVILTDRLHGPDGQPIRSPFAYVNHPEQTADLEPLVSILSDPSRSNYFGDIAGTGAQHVAFAWTFTTQPVYEDLRLLRDGLYGKGPFASLSTQFPTNVTALRALGMATSPSEESAPLSTVPQCQAGLKTPYVVNVASAGTALQLIVQVALAETFSLTASQEQAILNSLDSVDHFVIGEFTSPYLVGSDPTQENPEESFDLDFQTGQGRIASDTVPFFLAVPKEKPGSQQPFPTTVWSHGTSLFMEEAIVRMGYFARQGVATLAIDMPGHGLYLTNAQQNIAEIALGTSCDVEWLSALTACAQPTATHCAGRAYDLNGDGTPDSGGYLWSAHIFHSRDNIRQSVVDQMQTVRMIRSFDGKTLSAQDYNFDGTPDLAGDFDGDGTPDIGETQPIYTSGDSYGGIVAMIHGAVDPYVTASAPISGGGGLIDIAQHSSLIPTPVLEQIFSPLVIAVPASTRGPGSALPTNCTGNQMSLRFEVNSLLDSAELEIACLDPTELGPNMTVLVTNTRNNVTQCAGTTGQGLLRVPIAADQGDPISIQVFNQANAVDSYKSCTLVSGATPGRLVNSWEQGASVFTPVANGATCPSSSGCQLYWSTFYPVGSPLVAPQEGLGYARQTPDARRLFSLTQAAIDVADPINFAPYYMMKPIPGLNGETLPHRGILVSNTVGDPYVPIATGSAFARAAGALPFLPPDAATTIPEYANYATPQPMYDAFGGVTPNDLLLQEHVIRGIARLGYTRAGPNCGVNYLTNPPASLQCGTPPAVDPTTCAQTLFDADWNSQGTNLYAASHPATPLRLGRLTTLATDPTSLAQAWAPRISTLPASSPDGPAGNVPMIGLVNAYVNPLGQHVFFVNDPCRAFDDVTYYDTMLVRFLATGGTDIYAVSHPQTNGCMATQTCPFD
ncbi:MAG: hypothetical protein ACLQVI_34105 [Polyangiaceae bacterium]